MRRVRLALAATLVAGLLTAPVIAADDDGHPDLLPGVDLVTKEVAPGVFRVLGDGEHDLRWNVWDVAVGTDGDVWVVKYRIVYADGYNPGHTRVRYRDARVLRLGMPGVALDGGSSVSHPPVGLSHSDGLIVVDGPGRYDSVVWDGQGWQTRQKVDDRSSGCLEPVDPPCWQVQWAPNSEPFVRVDGPQPLAFSRADIGVPAGAVFSGWLASGPDDGIWFAYLERRASDGVRLAGLASYDGERWQTVGARELDLDPMALAVSPDGDVWVVGHPMSGARDHTLTAARWDGNSWLRLDDLDGRGGVDLRFGPGGSVWFNPLTRYDGSRLRQLALPASTASVNPVIGSHADTTDGSVWVVVTHEGTPERLGCEESPKQCRGATDGLYLITPRAFTASE